MLDFTLNRKQEVAVVGVALLAFVLGLAMPCESHVLAFQSPIVTPTPVVPGGGDVIPPDDLVDLPGLLSFLAGPLSIGVLGVLFSQLLDNWAWYAVQSTQVKRAIPMLAGIAVSIGSRLLLVYVPPEVWEMLAPFWAIAASWVAFTYGGELRYLLTRAKASARKAEEVATGYLQAPREE